jgi:archaeal flagellar protein FlaG
MPGTAASQMIFFIAAMMVATAVAGVFITTTINLAKDMKKGGDDIKNQFNTQITVINDPSAMPYNSTCSTLVLYIKNIGSADISQDTVMVALNGSYFTKANMTFQLLDGASAWKNEVVLAVTIYNVTLASGDHSLMVRVQGIEFTTFKFKI